MVWPDGAIGRSVGMGGLAGVLFGRLDRMAHRQVVSVWLPRLATDVLLRRRSALRGLPVVTVTAGRRGQVVVATTRAAEAAGVGPGMSLADARAVEPALVALAADSAAVAASLDGLLTWCQRYTPLVAPDRDGLLLDVTGCCHLCGGPDGLLRDLTMRLRRGGFTAAAALAPTPAAAWALARYGDSGTMLLCAPDDPDVAARLRAALAELPVAALRLDGATVAGLAAVGVRRIADIETLSRGGLTDRFGGEVLRRLDLALGLAEEPLSLRRPPPVHGARRSFAEPIGTAAAIAAAIADLLDQVCAGLAASGQGARRLELLLYRCDGDPDRPPQSVSIGTGRPVRTPHRLVRLFADRLEQIDPGAGIEAMVLVVSVAEPLAPDQPGLPVEAAGLAGAGAGAGAGGSEEVDALIDRLGNRLGRGAVARPVLRERWLPERAVVWPGVGEGAGVGVDTGAGAGAGGEGAGEVSSWPMDRSRPVRLLVEPEPIEVMAPVPDDPPVMFRWRNRVHRIGRAEGPERLAAEWWLGDGECRDYYRVEDGDGRRFWVFRAGPYQSGRVARWYLHGFFG